VLLAAYGVSLGHPELGPAVAIVVVSLAVVGTLLTQAGPRIGLWIQAFVRSRSEGGHGGG
jgi:hypothetical protein